MILCLSTHTLLKSPRDHTQHKSGHSWSQRWSTTTVLVPPRRQRHVVAANKLGDELLDYIVGGPKLRKWYGEGERLPRDGGEPEQPPVEEEEENIEQDAVLVTDADSALGELIVLRLILERAKVRILVKDAQAAKTAFGPYVTAIAGDVGDEMSVLSGLKGARAVICPGKLGVLAQLAVRKQLQHIILLSSAGLAQPSGFSLGSLFGGEEAALRDASREAAVQQSGVPHTIIRAGRIRGVPGGNVQLKFSQGGTLSGEISREDIAGVVVGAWQIPPTSALTFEVAGAGPGSPPLEWQPVFETLKETAPMPVRSIE